MISIGSSVNHKIFENKIYRDLLTKFDYLYADGSFRENNLAQNREIINFCIQNNKKIRGNCIISSPCISKFPNISKQQIEYQVKDRANFLFSNFPEINYWESVHECFDDNGSLRKQAYSSSLGENWIFTVNKWIKQVAPDSNKLFYCDYFRDDRKLSSVYNFIKSEKSTFDGISIQLHSNIFPQLNPALIKTWIKKFKSLGLLIHCPETVVWQPAESLNIRDFKKKVDINRETVRFRAGQVLKALSDVESTQAKIYHDLVLAAIEGGADMVGFWSAFDTAPWNWVGNRAKAGLWDEKYKPKKALIELQKILPQLKG